MRTNVPRQSRTDSTEEPPGEAPRTPTPRTPSGALGEEEADTGSDVEPETQEYLDKMLLAVSSGIDIEHVKLMTKTERKFARAKERGEQPGDTGMGRAEGRGKGSSVSRPFLSPTSSSPKAGRNCLGM